MKKLLAIILFIMSLTACASLIFTPEQAFDQLREAQTPEEEAAVFRQIWNKSNDLSFYTSDEDSEALSVSSPDFPARLHAIDLRINGEIYHHILIEPENIYILMRE